MLALRSRSGFGLTEFVLVTVVVAVAVGVFLTCCTQQAPATDASEFAVAPSGPTSTTPAVGAPVLCVDGPAGVVQATPVV